MADLEISGSINPPILAYATTGDLTAYLAVEESTLPADAARLLQRASELVYSLVRRNYDSTVAMHVEAARNATCAQVEYWAEVGEDAAFSRNVQSETHSKVSTTYFAGGRREIAPRAYRFLLDAGLLYAGV